MKAGHLLAGLLIALALTSAAHAEKYIEVWNPPEARGHSAAQKPAHPRSPAPAAPRLARKVTEPGHAQADQRTPSVAPSVASSKRSANRSIPRKIGPDGNVFRV
ncbi:hypothetical protein H3V53_23585 [Paraburkholderia bengalensis]|uniref:Uncharacterized protein n=1 Tax=Paraburkholderia bengalensis TaxID=2747562 RepID=A0ABU8IWQ2_9BURK